MKNLKRAQFLLVSCAFILGVGYSHTAFASTYVSDYITADEIWTKDDGPYIVNDVTIPEGVTLTVEPGTVIKVAQGAVAFDVRGALNVGAGGAFGTDKAYITSINDDIGGVTPGSNGSPSFNDWARIYVHPGASALFNNTSIRYGGYNGYYGFTPLVNDGSVSLIGSEVREANNTLVYQLAAGATLTAKNSTFTCSLGSYCSGVSAAEGDVDAVGNTFNTYGQGIGIWGEGLLTLKNNTFNLPDDSYYAVYAASSVLPKNEGGNTGTGSFVVGPQQAISGDYSLPPDGINYLLFDFAVPSGSSLTLLPGLKARLNSGLSVSGSLTIGSSLDSNPVLLTSWLDDAGMGKKSFYGQNYSPKRGDWKGIDVKSGGKFLAGNVTLRYAGQGKPTWVTNTWCEQMTQMGWTPPECTYPESYWQNSAVRNEGGLVNLDGVHVLDSGTSGVRTTSGTTTITDSEIANNTQSGLLAEGGTTNVSHSSIWGNASGATATNGAIIAATNNWWGDATGPEHSSNPNGKGQVVSDGVSFDPYYTDATMMMLSVKPIKVAVILAETSDVAHKSDSMTAQPCKLIPEKTYANGYSKEYYTDLLYCVHQYWIDNSYGKVNLQFEIFDNGGGWYKTGKNESDYGLDGGIQFAIDSISSTQGLVATSSPHDLFTAIGSPNEPLVANRWSMWPEATCGNIVDPRGVAFVMQNSPMGVFAHEFGHALSCQFTPLHSMLPDLYEMGNIKKWDLMGSGNNNGAIEGDSPASLSSFSRIFLGFLGESVLPSSAMGFHSVAQLANTKSGDATLRYNLSDNTSTTSQKYYLIEGRDRTLGTWDTGLPGSSDRNIVLYYVDTHGYARYGWATDSNGKQIAPALSYQSISIPGNSLVIPSDLVRGVMSIGDVYRDYAENVRFAATNENDIDGVQISKILPTDYPGVMGGTVFTPGVTTNADRSVIGHTSPPFFYFQVEDNAIPIGSVLSLLFTLLLVKKLKIRGYGKILLLWLTLGFGLALIVSFTAESLIRNFNNSFRYSPGLGHSSTVEATPALHLEVLTPDGRHVGINKDTGEWESQITGSIVSGPNGGAPEWIYVPDVAENKGVKYYVASTEIERYANAHPEVKGALLNATSTYEIYGRYVDPAAGIFTSPTLTNQEMKVGSSSVFEIFGTSTPVIAKPVARIIPDAKEMIVGGALPTFTYKLEGVGASDVAGTALCSTATDGASVGTFAITCAQGSLTSKIYDFTFATDTLSVRYDFSGFLDPIKSNTVYKAGRTLPIKFQIKNAGGAVIQAANAPEWITVEKLGAVTSDPTITTDAATVDSGATYRYDTNAGQYVYNWSTKDIAPGYWYKIGAKLDDGTIKTVVIGLR